VAAAPGIVAVARGAAGPRWIAVNVDPAESDPARLAHDEFVAPVARQESSAAPGPLPEARQQEDREHLWRYALMALLAVLILESVIGMRTA
jgi:hypothetical protein